MMVVKSALNREQLLSRKDEKGIEIQLLGDNLGDIEEWVSFIVENELPIVTVHTAFTQDDDTYLANLDLDLYRDRFNYCIDLANRIGEELNSIINVVIHNIHTLNELSFMLSDNCVTSKIEFIEDLLLDTLSNNNHINISIENLIPLIVKNSEVITSNAVKNENVELIKYFRDVLYKYKDRIFGVLDIIHASITIDTFKSLGIDITLDNYFRWYMGVCNIIHCGIGKNTGYGFEEHGAPYTDKTINKCKHFIELYYKYDFITLIVPEVFEKDYINYPNYKQSKKIIQYYLDNTL